MIIHKAFAFLVAVGLFSVPASAQIVPLNFGSTNNMVDEFGQLLEGTAFSPGDLVQILEGKHGIFPPNLDGTPNADNPIIKTAKIGEGTAPSAGAIGKVAGSISELANRSSPNNTNTIFARVFNGPTVESSSFYADSSLYDVPVAGDKYGIFFIDSSKTESAIDENDADSDGLNNSWEKSYGTDLNNPDSDNDGVMDGQEIPAGTDPNDNTSLLMMVELFPGPDGHMEVMWDSVAGKVYQLEFTTNALSDMVSFQPINPQVTASGPTASTIVTNGTIPEVGTSFRVEVVVP